MDSEVVAAIVAGVVSLLISSIAGIYTLAVNRKRLEILKNELIVTAATNRVLTGRETFLDSFKKCEVALATIKKSDPHDFSKIGQYVIHFYGTTARDFYMRNKSTLGSPKLDELMTTVNETLASGTMDSPDNHEARKKFVMDIVAFCSGLNKRVLDVT